MAKIITSSVYNYLEFLTNTMCKETFINTVCHVSLEGLEGSWSFLWLLAIQGAFLPISPGSVTINISCPFPNLVSVLFFIF